jgi:CO dehydrogenase/acetyl-CoA synthase beta subunit
MVASSLVKKLKSFGKTWKGVEPRQGAARIHDGDYTCRIDDVVLEEAKNSGRLQVAWHLVVIEGDQENKKVVKRDGIEDEDGMAWLQGTLEKLELEIPEDIEDLGETLEEAKGLEVSVSVVTKDEYQNIYINELVGEESGEEEEPEEEEEAEEEPEEEEEAEEEVSEDDIMEMSSSDLKSFIKDNELDVNSKRHKSLSSLRKAVVKAFFE